ncbi:MAG: hypothetical protein VZR09_04625 [Candidatus Gastranaerophilaceae bacterium]|nr:hypothetical protein [Candidatus Gastranaerophilaceae bacterium]
MCVKISSVNSIPVRRRPSALLYTSTHKVATLVSDHAQYITQNVRMNPLSVFLFNMVDYLTPIINKHQKFSKPLLSVVERVVNFSQHV